MKEFALILLSLISLEQTANALELNYRIYREPGFQYLGLKTDLSYNYTGKSSGNYRQVVSKFNGISQFGWVHSAAITGSDFSHSLKQNYNVRIKPSSKAGVMAKTNGKNFVTTGVERGVWKEVVSSHGEKGWVNRRGVNLDQDSKPYIFPDSVGSQKPTDSNLGPKEITVSPTPTPVPYTILNPDKKASATNAPEDAEVINNPADNPGGRPKADEESAIPVENSIRNLAECAGFTDLIRRKNCEFIMAKVLRGELPRKSTVFALKTFNETLGAYCGGKTINEKYRNKCSFAFSDLDKRSKANSNKSAAYFIDLCAGDASRSEIKNVVTDFGTNRGSGTQSNGKKLGYSDVPSKFTTIAGVFMTKGIRAFNPSFSQKNKNTYRNQLGYRPGDPRCSGQGNYRNGFLKSCPVIAMDLERIDGARTDDSKPMHTSPSSYRTSGGCPSIDQDKNWILRQMASQGNSLYIAYTEKSSEKDHFNAPQEVCRKDPDTLSNPNDNSIDAFPGRDTASTR